MGLILKHHGILGQKWGVLTGGRDGIGPGAPGGRRGSSNRDVARAQELLNDQNALDNADIQTLRNLADRIDVQQRLKTQVARDYEESRGFVSKTMEKLKNTTIQKASEFAVNKLMSTIEKKVLGDPFKGIKDMPTDQLKEQVARLGLENQLKRLIRG